MARFLSHRLDYSRGIERVRCRRCHMNEREIVEGAFFHCPLWPRLARHLCQVRRLNDRWDAFQRADRSA